MDESWPAGDALERFQKAVNEGRSRSRASSLAPSDVIVTKTVFQRYIEESLRRVTASRPDDTWS